MNSPPEVAARRAAVLAALTSAPHATAPTIARHIGAHVRVVTWDIYWFKRRGELPPRPFDGFERARAAIVDARRRPSRVLLRAVLGAMMRDATERRSVHLSAADIARIVGWDDSHVKWAILGLTRAGVVTRRRCVFEWSDEAEALAKPELTP